MRRAYWFDNTNRAMRLRRGFAGVDSNKIIPAGSTLLYSVTFNDVAFGVNWGFNWFGSGACRDAINAAIRSTESFNSVSTIPGNFTDNNCVQAQVQLVTAFEWNVGDMRWVLDDFLTKAGFSVNSSNLTVIAVPSQASREPQVVTPGQQSTSPMDYYQSPNARPKGLLEDFFGGLGIDNSTLILGGVILVLYLLKK